jgi:hypothetical protein
MRTSESFTLHPSPGSSYTMVPWSRRMVPDVFSSFISLAERHADQLRARPRASHMNRNNAVKLQFAWDRPLVCCIRLLERWSLISSMRRFHLFRDGKGDVLPSRSSYDLDPDRQAFRRGSRTDNSTGPAGQVVGQRIAERGNGSGDRCSSVGDCRCRIDGTMELSFRYISVVCLASPRLLPNFRGVLQVSHPSYAPC